jgi:hypothetical protein
MAKTTQITVTASSKPGVLAKICDAESAGRGKMRLVVSDLARAKAALAAAKIRCGEEPGLLLSMDDRPGALADLASRLAAAKINMKCAYASTAGDGRVQVVVAVANPDKAERALG